MKTISFEEFRINAARRRFEMGRKSRPDLGSKLTFDEYLKLFSDKRNSFDKIANLAGITRGAIRVKYNKYFRPLTPGAEMGSVRRCNRETDHRAAVLEKSPRYKYLREVLSAAIAARCTAQTVDQSRGPYPHCRHILINNRRCFIAVSRALAKNANSGRQCYTVFRLLPLSLMGCDFVIFLQQVPKFPKRIFIVPARLLLNGNPSNKPKQCFIPIVRLPVYHNNHPVINFWEYENGWWRI